MPKIKRVLDSSVMQSSIFAIILSSELSFYLLIIQTGIVDYFHSDLFKLYFLPLGGVVGSLILFGYLFSFAKYSGHIIRVLLFFQTMLSIFYPFYGSAELFLLGTASGLLAPMLVERARYFSIYTIGVALAFSYTIGTILINIPSTQRDTLAISLSLIAFISSFGLIKNPTKVFVGEILYYRHIVCFVGWVILDTSLFETLSRDSLMSIWRQGYTIEIVVFHILGVFFAILLKNKRVKNWTVLFLFFASYLSYLFKIQILLAAFYPFVISFYNVIIFENLILVRSWYKIGFLMFLIGWIASGIGLVIAINHNMISSYLLLLLLILSKYFSKEINV